LPFRRSLTGIAFVIEFVETPIERFERPVNHDANGPQRLIGRESSFEGSGDEQSVFVGCFRPRTSRSCAGEPSTRLSRGDSRRAARNRWRPHKVRQEPRNLLVLPVAYRFAAGATT
jgi:hypothetical protein